MTPSRRPVPARVTQRPRRAAHAQPCARWPSMRPHRPSPTPDTVVVDGRRRTIADPRGRIPRHLAEESCTT
jgi:hypothetical protein